MKYKITICVLVFFIISCKHPSDENNLEVYKKESTELINQILTDKEIDCSCLLEPTGQSIIEFMAEETPIRNNRKDLKEGLELTIDSVFDKQNELTQLFRISELNLKTKMTFLKKAEFVSIFKNNSREKAGEIFRNKCPSGILSLSPPIYNENYNIAIITVNGCSSGGSMNKYIEISI